MRVSYKRKPNQTTSWKSIKTSHTAESQARRYHEHLDVHLSTCKAQNTKEQKSDSKNREFMRYSIPAKTHLKSQIDYVSRGKPEKNQYLPLTLGTVVTILYHQRPSTKHPENQTLISKTIFGYI